MNELGDTVFYIGPRRCGKSVLAENIINSSFNNPVYIATLPVMEEYYDTIQNHKKRRGNSWNTVELSFNFNEDLGKIISITERLDKNAACLLDGIWTWYHFQNQIGDRKIDSVYFIKALIQIINSSNINWFLVDINYYKCSEELLMMHRELTNNINRLKIIEIK